MSCHDINKFSSLAEAFLSRINGDGEIIFMDRKGSYTPYSYGALWESSLRYAHYLQMEGVKKGDVISLILPSCPEFISIFIGAQILGAVPVSLYPMMSLGDVDGWKERTLEMLKQVDCQHFFGTDMIKLLIQEELLEANIKPHAVEDVNLHKESLEYACEYFPGESDLCFLQFSSGTTSAPKPVMITQRNALLNAQIIVDKVDQPMDDLTTVSWLPLYHDMGLVGTFISSILGGKNLVIIRPDDFIRKPALWLRAMSDYKAKVTTGPNFAYGLAVKRITAKQMEGLDLSHATLVGCGAEAVYKETMDKFINKFSKVGLNPRAIVPMYGMAEATVAVSFSEHTEEIKWKTFDDELLTEGIALEVEKGKTLCSLGKPLPTFEVYVKDKEGNNLPEGHVGRLFIKSPCVFAGYYNDPIKTEASFQGDLLDTGDEGFLIDGEIFIAGRAKDTMIIRGKNYYPTIFEESLTVVRALREGRVIVSSSYFEESDTEEMIVLAEVKKEKYLEETVELKQLVQNVLTSNGELTPKVVEFYAPGTLPRTSSGKLRRAAAVNMWANGTFESTPKTGLRARTRFLGTVVKNTLSKAVRRVRS